MRILNSLPAWLTNKYFLSSCFFLSWMIFFDHNDLATQLSRRSELKSLQSSKAYYRDQIDSTRKAVENIRVSAFAMEKIAREKYMMKKDNEEVFIIPEQR